MITLIVNTGGREGRATSQHGNVIEFREVPNLDVAYRLGGLRVDDIVYGPDLPPGEVMDYLRTLVRRPKED